MPSLPLFVVGKLTAALLNGVVNAVNPMGQSFVLPSSAAVGSGSAATSTLGNVTYSAASSVSLNGIFTSAYNHHTVKLQVDSVSATLTITAVFRLAGVDVTSANYDLEVLQGQSAVAAAAAGTAAAAWTVSAITGTLHDVTLELNNPAIASATYGTAFSSSIQNPSTAPGVAVRGISHRLPAAYDGITFIFTGGTATGSARDIGTNKG